MRRWMRVLLVGVLSLLLSIDSASACRFLRNRCRPRCRTVTCHRPRTVAHCPPVAYSTTTNCSPCCVSVETIVVETPQCCVPADGSAHAEIVEAESQPLATTPTTDNLEILAPTTAQPAPAAPSIAAEKPAPVAPVETPLPPLEQAVAPASAQEPVPQPQFKTAKEILAESAAEKAAESAEQVLAAEKAAQQPVPAPAPAPEENPAPDLPAEETPAEKTPAPQPEPEEDEPVVEPAEERPAPKKPAEPDEENLFDEADENAGDDSEPALVPVSSEDAEPVPAAQPAAVDDLFGEAPARETPADEPVAEPAEEVPASEPADAADASADEPAEDPADEPAEGKEEGKEPAAEDDPFAGILQAPHEPVRRWIDNTGLHETVGRLVEVHPDHIRILKANGRHATVPFSRLSRHDQSYISTTSQRLAAEQRSAKPATLDTAAL